MSEARRNNQSRRAVAQSLLSVSIHKKHHIFAHFCDEVYLSDGSHWMCQWLVMNLTVHNRTSLLNASHIDWAACPTILIEMQAYVDNLKDAQRIVLKQSTNIFVRPTFWLQHR